MSRPVIGPSEARFARCSAQITPYSARVVMRTVGLYAPFRELTRLGCSRSLSSVSCERLISLTSCDCTMGTPRNADLGHLAQIQDLVDLILRQHPFLLDEITDENVF